MSWLGDAWDAIIDVAEEIPVVSGLVDAGRAVEEFAPGFIEDVGDVLSSPIDTIVDGAEFVGEAMAGFGALLLSPLAIAGDVIGGVTEFAGDALDTVTFGGASWVMDQVDDYVFDSVDWATGGAIDIDFDDGAFSVDLGMNEVASFGFSIGEQGFTADGYLVGLGAGVGMTTDDGFTVDLKADLPFLDEVGVGVGLELDEGGDDAFFLDIDGRVLPEDAPPDAGGEVTGQPDATAPTSPVTDGAIQVAFGADDPLVQSDDGGEVAASTEELFASDDISVATVVVDVPDEATAASPTPDTDFARDVANADAVADTADDVWNDVG